MMGGCCGGWGGWWGFGMGMGWLGMIFNLLFWVLIILAVVWGIRWLLRNTNGVTPTTTSGATAQAQTEDPKRLLQIRYARGEITREEYLQMLADLEGRSTN